MMQPNTDPTGNQKNSDYKPASCDLSDELELLAVQKKSVRFKISADHGATIWKVGQIADLFAKDHADFMKLVDGTVIRLDKILEWSVH